jgi:hypothetical protein
MVTPEFRAQFTAASRIAFRRYQSFAGEPYWGPLVASYSLSRDRAYTPPPPREPNFEVEKLYPNRAR